MSELLVLVVAAVDSHFFGDDEPYYFKRGQVGVVTWKSHNKKFGYLQPFALWDDDPQRVPRRILYDAVQPIGLQIGMHRIRVP